MATNAYDLPGTTIPSASLEMPFGIMGWSWCWLDSTADIRSSVWSQSHSFTIAFVAPGNLLITSLTILCPWRLVSGLEQMSILPLWLISFKKKFKKIGLKKLQPVKRSWRWNFLMQLLGNSTWCCPNRSPRLVVNSSIPGVTAHTCIPNHVCYPASLMLFLQHLTSQLHGSVPYSPWTLPKPIEESKATLMMADCFASISRTDCSAEWHWTLGPEPLVTTGVG